jgi:hypothetical protein
MNVSSKKIARRSARFLQLLSLIVVGIKWMPAEPKIWLADRWPSPPRTSAHSRRPSVLERVSLDQESLVGFGS